MTGTALLLTIVIGLIKILATCLPTGVVEILIRKFEMHAKLNEEKTTITFEGKCLEGESKRQIIHDFNNASVLKKHYIFPGNEHLFLNPENGSTPIVIDTKKGKQSIKLFLFRYDNHVDIVRQYKNKVISYSLSSEPLQKQSLSLTEDLT